MSTPLPPRVRFPPSHSTSHYIAPHIVQLGDVDATSFLYETAPMYVEEQPRFLNAACRLKTELDPAALLERLKTLEASLGR